MSNPTKETIDPEQINKLFLDSLFRDSELNPPPIDFLQAEGITCTVGFHPARLESHREEVRDMLLLLPDQFMETKGGGWTFLNACNDKHGNQWTGLHQRMEQLFQMGIALKLASLPLPRPMWQALPGGMPYVVVNDKV